MFLQGQLETTDETRAEIETRLYVSVVRQESARQTRKMHLRFAFPAGCVNKPYWYQKIGVIIGVLSVEKMLLHIAYQDEVPCSSRKCSR